MVFKKIEILFPTEAKTEDFLRSPPTCANIGYYCPTAAIYATHSLRYRDNYTARGCNEFACTVKL